MKYKKNTLTKTKKVIVNSSENLIKSNTVSGSKDISKLGSDIELTLAPSKSIISSEFKTNIEYLIPDYEEELRKKANSFENDKCKDILLFPKNDIQFSKNKIEEIYEYYSIYDVDDISQINCIAKKNIEVLSSNITDYTLTFNYEDYGSYFYLLPQFKPLEQKIYKHNYGSEYKIPPIFNNAAIENRIDSSPTEEVLSLKIIKTGYMQMYPPLIDNSINIEKWISSNKAKKKFFNLTRKLGEKYPTLEYKSDKSKKYTGIYYLEYCTCLKQCNSIRNGNSFEMHINDKILIFVCENINEFNDWITCIANTTLITLEQERNTKQNLINRRNNNIQDSWESSQIPKLIEYSRETDSLNQRSRSEIRYKLYSIYTDIFDNNEIIQLDTESIYVPSSRNTKRLYFELNKLEMIIKEQYVMVFSYFDIKDGLKLSEDFIYNVSDNELDQLNFGNWFFSYDEIFKNNEKIKNYKPQIKGFFFDIQELHDDIYLIVRLYKIYSSSLNKIWELYTKYNNNKNENTLLNKMNNDSMISRIKKYLLPIGFSFKRIFIKCDIDKESKFYPLIKYDYKYSNNDIIKIIQDIKNDFKPKNVLNNFFIDCNIFFDINKVNLFSPSLELYKPFNKKINECYIEITNLYLSNKKFKGYDKPINLLMLSLLNFNVTLKSSFKVKNTIISIQVFNKEKVGENELGLPIIYTKSNQLGFYKISTSSVICGTTNISLLDEFKILLPSNSQPDLHLLISFHSVSHDEKDDKKKKCDDIYGYTWLKLFNSNQIIESREYHLPVCTTIPQHYLSINLEKIERSKLSSDIKWIDGSAKPVLKMNLNFITNYYSSNEHLTTIIKYIHDKGIIKPEDSFDLCRNIKWLYSLEFRLIIIHFNMLMKMIFDLLINSCNFIETHRDKAEDLQKNSIKLMLLISGELCRKGKDDLLRGYIKKRLNCQTPNNDYYLHDIVLQHLNPSMNYGSDPEMKENFYLSCWFFLQIIYKSIAINALYFNRIIQNRKNFLRPTSIELLIELIGVIICLIRNRICIDFTGAEILHRNLSKFLVKLFSCIDRGLVFKLIALYIKNFSDHETNLTTLKFDTLNRIQNYEHIIPLNIPYETVWNKNSVNNLITLSVEYLKMHFPFYIIFTQINKYFNSNNIDERKQSIKLLRNILIKFDYDDRINTEEKKSRIHMLFLPLLSLFITNFNLLRNSAPLIMSDENSYTPSQLNEINSNSTIKMETLDKKKWASYNRIKESEPNIYANIDNINKLSFKDLREIVLVFLQIIKTSDINFVMEWLKCYLSKSDQRQNNNSINVYRYQDCANFLILLQICIWAFPPNFDNLIIKNTDAGLRLNNAIKSLRSSTSIKLFISYINLNKVELDSCLHCEIVLIVLDIIEKFYITFKAILEQDFGSTLLMRNFIDLHIFLLQIKTSLIVRKNHMALLRQLIIKSPNVLFKGSNNYCYLLSIELLRLAGCNMNEIQTESINLLYLLLRSDYYNCGVLYHRSYVSVIMAISNVVEKYSNTISLFECMNELIRLVKLDHIMKDNEFANQINDLVRRVKNILRLTLKFKELETDPEWLVDAHLSIANSFIGIPELRQTWLIRVSKLHLNYFNYSEAAMCIIHIASLISVTLKRKSILSKGHTVFYPITPNISSIECNFKEEALTDESQHSIDQFCNFVKSACQYLYNAERYEIMADVYKIIIPFLEENSDYPGLSEIYSMLKQAYDKIIETSYKRFFGTYYRIGFYGHSFKEYHGYEFIYKEPKVTPLADIYERMIKVYTPICDNLTFILESYKVKWKDLDPNNDYIQLNAVKPYYSNNNEVPKSNFYQHHNIGEFVLETPFTTGGKAHGSVEDQCKRITILTTCQTFPYIKKRIPIIKSRMYELNPLEVCTQQLIDQIQDMENEIHKYPPDMKCLQLKLQGSIGVSVNAGPLSIAEKFILLDPQIYPPESINRLICVFKDFLQVSSQALELNSRLIKEDQYKYHRDLVGQYENLCSKFQALLTSNNNDSNRDDKSTVHI